MHSSVAEELKLAVLPLCDGGGGVEGGCFATQVQSLISISLYQALFDSKSLPEKK